jgi:hypothetical protein
MGPGLEVPYPLREYASENWVPRIHVFHGFRQHYLVLFISSNYSIFNISYKKKTMQYIISNPLGKLQKKRLSLFVKNQLLAKQVKKSYK